MAKAPAPPVDPDVRVPRAVREGLARANAHYEGTPPPEAVPPPEGSQPPPDGAQPAPTDPSAPAETPSAQEPQSNEPVDWEARYKTDRGRWDAERKRSRGDLESMSNRIQQLEQQLVQQAPVPRTPSPKVNITPEELADYGEDFVSMIRRVAESVVDGKVEPLAGEIGRTRAQIGVQQNKTMHQQMDALFSKWQQLNAYDPFIEWTMLPDPYSGVIRQKLMQKAWDEGDAHRVNAFFQGFLAEEAALNPAGAGASAARAPAAPNGNGAPAATPPLALAALAAPGGARSASQGPAEKRTYTADDITRFYTEVAAGRWRGRDQERAEVDADIMRAQHEGRIITAQRYTPPEPPRGFTR